MKTNGRSRVRAGLNSTSTGGHALASESPKRGERELRRVRRRRDVHFSAARERTEITGPLAADLFVSSSTKDADLFPGLPVFSPDMREVVFMGAIDPHTPVAQGWLRASHRKLDPKLPRVPAYHTHDEPQPLEPGEVVRLDVGDLPTSIVVPAGHRVALTVRGKDYECRSRRAPGSRTSERVARCGRSCMMIRAIDRARFSAQGHDPRRPGARVLCPGSGRPAEA